MDMSKFKKFVDFYEIYELVANGEETISGIRDALRLEKGLSGGNLQRRIEYLSSDPPFLTVNQDWVKFEKESFAGILMELIEGLGLRDKFIPPHKKDEEIQEKVRRELERKVLVASTIEVGPEEKMSDGLFLVDPEYYLDVDACVAKYGGELDSFYEELESDDPGKKGFDPGRELTERNYALRTMKTVGTRRFFSKRIRDNKEVAEYEQSYGSVSPVSDKRQEKRKEILRNRFISLNKIIKSDKLTNQEKLMMYAMNSEYHNTNVERLLNYAGEHCLNADLLIYILEDPDVCTTYENTVGFLSQFAQASEFKMKLELARELIEGKWYITAEYDGKKTKFQLVPIDEINELRKSVGLPASQYTYSARNKDQEQEEPVSKPDFVERAPAGDSVDLPEDGFSMPPMDDEPYPF